MSPTAPHLTGSALSSQCFCSFCCSVPPPWRPWARSSPVLCALPPALTAGCTAGTRARSCGSHPARCPGGLWSPSAHLRCSALGQGLLKNRESGRSGGTSVNEPKRSKTGATLFLRNSRSGPHCGPRQLAVVSTKEQKGNSSSMFQRGWNLSSSMCHNTIIP